MNKNKKKMPRALKRLLITLLVLAILGGAGVGAYFLFKGEPEPVSVTSVSYLSTYNWEESGRGYGYVKADRFQQEYLSDTQVIEEIYVTVGQQVKEGDVIAKYDSTLSELEVESQDLAVQLCQIDLEDAQEELNQFIKKYGAGSSGSAATGTSSDETTTEAPETTTQEPETTTEAPETTAEESETDAPIIDDEEPIVEPIADETDAEETSPAEDPTLAPYDPENPEKLDLPEPYAGKGSKRDPYRIVWRHGQEVSSEFVWQLLTEHRTAKVVFEIHEGDTLEGELLYSWTATFENTGDHTYSTMINSVDIEAGVPRDPDFEDEEEPTEPTEPAPTDPDYPDFPDYPDEPEYTPEEIAIMRRELTIKVRDLDLKLRTEQQKLNKMRTELDHNTITAKVDGEVTELNDPEEAQMMNTAFVVISGGGGLYLHTGISELDLDKYPVGSTLSFMSWETGMTYEATITEISEFPITEGDTFSYNVSANASTYPVTAYIEDAVGLTGNEYGEVTFSDTVSYEEGNIYLANAYIRKEGSRSYVMAAGEDGTLEKRYIKTGKPLWGSYTEILAGVTTDDYLAFPYGTDVVEGAMTETASMDDIYYY